MGPILSTLIQLDTSVTRNNFQIQINYIVQQLVILIPRADKCQCYKKPCTDDGYCRLEYGGVCNETRPSQDHYDTGYMCNKSEQPSYFSNLFKIVFQSEELHLLVQEGDQ